MAVSRKSPLGKGLGALLPSSDENEQRSFFLCDIEAIVPNPSQPRKSIDDQTLAGLADSIREKGVLLPLVVRQVADGRFEIIAGERRWRAAGQAGLEKVPVLVKDVSPLDQLELALIENIQRQDLNPLEEAEAYLRLVQEFKLTQEEVARRVGKERSTVANALRVNNLPDFAKEDLAAGRISMGHARVLLSLEKEPALLRELRDEIVSQGLTVRQAEERSRRHKGGKGTGGNRAGSRRNSKQLPDSYCRTLTNDLTSRLETKVRIVQNGERGKIEIDYYSPDDLERVVSLIT